LADFSKSKTFAVVDNLFNQVGKIKNAVLQFFNGKGDASKGSPSSFFSSFGVVLNSFENMLKQGTDEFAQKALGFVDQGKSICSDFEKLFSDFNPAHPLNDSQKTEATQRLQNLEDSMKPMVAQGQQMSGGLATDQTQGTQISQETFGGDFGNERYKAYLELQMLRDAESRYDQVFGEVMKYHEEMKQLVSKMATLNLQEIKYEQILELLKQGIKMLAKIREQWGKLVQFFTLVSVRAEVALNQTLVPFVQYAKEAEQSIGEGGLSKEDREFFLSILEDQAQDINKVAYFLYTLSSTYFDVSTKFLMNRLAGLAQMLATDNEAERQKLLIDLRDQANEAQDAIKLMSQQRPGIR
jgi:hypothetical protein